MPEINSFDNGQFCWAELATTDTAAAKSFYSSLFGWEIEDADIPGGGVYSMFTIGGRYVGAASDQQEQERSQGVPPHWNLYVSVDDADAFVKRAEAAGGTVLAPAFDVMDAGRMAVLADPTGAVVSLWQAGQHRGFGLVHEPGSWDWSELMTPDVEKAKAFYTETFGWDAGEYPTPDTQGHTYTMFTKGDTQIAGLMGNPAGMESTPPHWMVYYKVADIDGSLAKLKELGGQVYFGPQTVETVGTFATCADPQGAAFSLIEPASGSES